MAALKLELDTDVDLYVSSKPRTKADIAAFRQAFAELRKSPGYAESVARLDRTIARIEKSQAKSRAKKKPMAKRKAAPVQV